MHSANGTRPGARCRGGSPDGYADQTRAFYRDKIERHGLTHEGLGWRRRESQRRRFEALAQIGDMHGRRVLDVGAGLGDFLLFLWERGVVPIYVGIDLYEPLVAACRARFRHGGLGPRHFLVSDVLEFATEASFDYVVSSGLFGLDTPTTAPRIGPSLARMFSMCRRAVAVNFLSARAERRADHNLYVEPDQALAHAWELTPAVTLRHDYLPNDFTLYLYREPRWRSPAAGEE